MNSTQRIVSLTPPHISSEHIKEKITCIRPHRERIFNTSTQWYGDKLVCHNYGQGGGGWTFLFGCVQESLRQFEQELINNPVLKNKPITIIGAGCYGLLTAILLVRAGYTVSIVAQETEKIPSNNSAGFFFPCARKVSTPQETAIFVAMGMASFAVYQQIMKGEHPFIKEGPTMVPAYFGLDINPGLEPFVHAGLIPKPEQVIIDFGNGKRYPVLEYMNIFINPSVIMRELQRTREELSIPVIKVTIHNFDDCQDSIIFNCAGLGAKKLAGDTRMVPSQGHLITLKNQPPRDQVRYMINVKVIQRDVHGRERYELIYYAPKDDGVLGITFIRNEDSLTTNQHQFDRIMQRSQDFFGEHMVSPCREQAVHSVHKGSV